MDERVKAWEWRERALAAEDQLATLREAIEVDRGYNLAAMKDLTAERDRLRAVVAAAREYLSQHPDEDSDQDYETIRRRWNDMIRLLDQLDVSPNTGT